MAASVDGLGCTAAGCCCCWQDHTDGGQHPDIQPFKGQPTPFAGISNIRRWVLWPGIPDEICSNVECSFHRKGRLDLFNRMLLHGSTSAHSTSRQERGKGRCDWWRADGSLWLAGRQDRAGKRLGAKHSYDDGGTSYLRASPTADINS